MKALEQKHDWTPEQKRRVAGKYMPSIVSLSLCISQISERVDIFCVPLSRSKVLQKSRRTVYV
jgi:hypothetical protein